MDDSKQREKCRIYDVRPEICKQFICCSEKRKKFELKNTDPKDFRIVNVREEFFGDERKEKHGGHSSKTNSRKSI